MSEKHAALFPKIHEKNLLAVPISVSPPGTVDTEEEACVHPLEASLPHAFKNQGIFCKGRGAEAREYRRRRTGL